ncbi:MAG: hypothetical protein D3914_14130 [Candidatus Electrothrix sp. LOE2]|nr:hypothetical protein [Candidatus Electrothrix sp. LOE2]
MPGRHAGLPLPRYKGENMDALTCITNRRSIRAFQDKPVSDNLLREIIAAACWSPPSPGR